MAKQRSEPRDEGSRAALTDREWVQFARPARAAGKGRGPRVPRALPPLLTPARTDAGTKYRRADWIGKLARQRADPGAVLDQLASRLERAPTEEALREAGVLLEELSRLPDGQKHISKRLTQEAVGRVTTAGGTGRVG